MFTQYTHYQHERYSDYGDYAQYSSTNGQERSPDLGLQQTSFFDSSRSKLDGGNHESTGINSGNFGGYGGLTPPPEIQTGHDSSNINKYYVTERHAIVPSSLRELEESYIRSLSSSNPAQISYLGPFGERINQNRPPPETGQLGLENYSGFIMNRRHFDKNFHSTRPSQKQHQQSPSQSAPITYGFPLLNQQVSATNSIDFGPKDKNKKFFETSQKDIVPNFPDFSDRPPIPEEPEIPSEEDEVEVATRKPPETYILPKQVDFTSFSGNASPSSLASPPPIFDPSFPEPVIQRGFIPSFGPPTKSPYFPEKPGRFKEHLHEHELFNNQLSSQADVSTTSPVPVLRPEFPDEKEISPGEMSSISPTSTEKPTGGTIYKHISVHVPAEDLDKELSAPKVIKVAKKPEKHIKVIFIKPPEAPPQKTEVEVPASPQQKTLVYVLSESGGTRTPIKLVTPSPLKPAPPQVFFLRYTNPSRDNNRPTLSSPDDENLDIPEVEDPIQQRPPSVPPIKQLLSPRDPDSDVLRSAPAPILPTFPSGFSSPASVIEQQLALQSSLTPPTIFTKTNYGNIAYPTHSKHQGTAKMRSSSLMGDQQFTNNQLLALHNNNLPALFQPQSNSDPSGPRHYSSLYHLYPPPALASVPNQTLLTFYLNPNNYQRHPQPESQSQFYSVAQPKVVTKPTTSSIQGLYSVAPNVKSFSDINFNSLVQNPDGKNLPRSTRNFIMMNYAPTYMPTAAGSEHVPVFTSPADFIKSLLGDSYMYYNNIVNNSEVSATMYSQTTPSKQVTADTAGVTVAITAAPKPQRTSIVQTQAKHHTIPLILNWANFQNSSAFQNMPDHSQPFTLIVTNSFGQEGFNKTAIQNTEPVYPHLRPLIPLQSASSTAKPQARISWAPSTASPPITSIHVPPSIKVDETEYQGGHHFTAKGIVSSHVNNLFKDFLDASNQKNPNGSKQFADDSQSDSSSSSNNSGSGESTSSVQQGSGEEIFPFYYYSSSMNSTGSVDTSNGSSYSSSNMNLNSFNAVKVDIKNDLPKLRSDRRRVNPALVKPGRRLRKVRKPHKTRRKIEGNAENSSQFLR